MYFSKTSVALYNIALQPVRTVGYFGGVYWGWGWEMLGGDKEIRGSVLEILFSISPFLVSSLLVVLV